MKLQCLSNENYEKQCIFKMARRWIKTQVGCHSKPSDIGSLQNPVTKEVYKTVSGVPSWAINLCLHKFHFYTRHWRHCEWDFRFTKEYQRLYAMEIRHYLHNFFMKKNGQREGKLEHFGWQNGIRVWRCLLTLVKICDTYYHMNLFFIHLQSEIA